MSALAINAAYRLRLQQARLHRRELLERRQALLAATRRHFEWLRLWREFVRHQAN